MRWPFHRTSGSSETMLDFDSFTFFADLLAMMIVVLPLFYLLRRPAHRRLLLGLVGLYLVFLIAPRLALFYVMFWAVVFVLQRVVAGVAAGRLASYAMTAAVVAMLVPMVAWKLWPGTFVTQFNLQLNAWLFAMAPTVGQIDAARQIILPLGVSFATFRAVDLLVQTYLGTVGPLSPGRLFFFGFFPPIQIIGPVMEYSEVAATSEAASTPRTEHFLEGLLQIAAGLFKVFVLAWPLRSSIDVFAAYPANPAPLIWLELVMFAIFFYFNFAGYSDIAIGASRLFGYKLKPNFASPYRKTNPQDFWNSWHMSLTRFAQRNVFVPLGGMRRRTQYPAAVATIMVIALWHDLTLPLVIFGLYHAAGLVAHRYVSGRSAAPVDRRHAGVKTAALFVFVALSLPLVVIEFGDIPSFYGSLVGVG